MNNAAASRWKGTAAIPCILDRRVGRRARGKEERPLFSLLVLLMIPVA